MDNSKKTLLIVFILFSITGGLFYVDYTNDRGDSPTYFSSIIRNWLRPRSITPEILNETSLKGSTISSLSRSNEFFSPYLALPENMTADRYTIDGSSLLISEVQVSDPYQTISSLLAQESSRYQFHQINRGSFYLNQIPADQKTHNFLAISLNNILYGFQYNPIDHRKVLELIDALQKTK